MSGSRAKLEQILELLLSEDASRAEELLHEYVVEKARAEYEKVLEAEDDLDAHEDEIEGDETMDADLGGDMADMPDHEDSFELDSEDDGEEEEDEDEEEGSSEDDLEDRVEELEDELEQLRAEFEELMAEEEGEEAHQDMDDMAKEGVAEATTFSKSAPIQPMKGAHFKGSEADSSNGQSPLSKKPKATTVAGAGAPVKAHDGSEGKHDHGSKPRSQDPTGMNIGIRQQKAAAPKKPE